MADSAPDEAMEHPKNILRSSILQPHTIATASQQRYLHFMFVCICNAIKEEELREVARHGVTDPEAAYAVLGKAPQCRVCLDHAEDVICDERARCAGRCPGRSLSAPSASFAQA
jgi:bacterioferritin-associated ferredoxin